MTRRSFITRTVGAGAAVSLTVGDVRSDEGGDAASHLPAVKDRKLLIIVFGGGVRSSETIDDAEHRYVPRLWNEMVPRGTLFTNMRVEGKVVHPNCTGSILTGHWEWDDIDWSRPVAHPTIFEVYRKARDAPDTDAWAFVYASILAKVGESLDPAYGSRFAANVLEPPTVPRASVQEMDDLMRRAACKGSLEEELAAVRRCQGIARSTSRISRDGLRSDAARAFLEQEYASWKSSRDTTSHDAFLADRAIACMRQFEPAVLVVAFGEIDCAHYGSWSRYVEAIRRTDELTWRLWRAVGELDAYRGRTLMLVLPDHGRELDRPGESGFIHHSDFYTNDGGDEGCRRVWMLALGPGVTSRGRVARPVPITAAASTGLDYLGLAAPNGAADSVLTLIGNRPH